MNTGKKQKKKKRIHQIDNNIPIIWTIQINITQLVDVSTSIWTGQIYVIYVAEAVHWTVVHCDVANGHSNYVDLNGPITQCQGVHLNGLVFFKWTRNFCYLDASKTAAHVCPNGHSPSVQYNDGQLDANPNWCINVILNRPIGRVSK